MDPTPDPLAAIDTQASALREGLETRRAQIFKYFLASTISAVAVIFFAAHYLLGPGPQEMIVSGVGSLVAAMVIYQLFFFLLYKPHVRETFMAALAQNLGFTYHHKGVFSLADVRRHGLLPPADIERAEDGFEGTIEGVPLAFQEVELRQIERYRDSSSNHDQTREHVVFQGLVVRIGIRKALGSHTVVIPNSSLQTFFRTMFSKYERVNLVSPKFEKRYDVLSTSQMEARYVLDPAFMERFMEAHDAVKPRWMEASFKGREILLAFHLGREAFRAPGLLLPVREKHVRDVTARLKSIVGLIKVLKINPYTGL